MLLPTKKKRKEYVIAFCYLKKKLTTPRGILSDLYDLHFRGHLPTFIERFLSNRLFQLILRFTIYFATAGTKITTDHLLLIQIQDMLQKIMWTRRKLFASGFLDTLVFGEMKLLIELLKKLLARNLQLTACPFQI